MAETVDRARVAKLPKYMLRKYRPGEAMPGDGADGLYMGVMDEGGVADLHEWFYRQPWNVMPPSTLDVRTNGELAREVLHLLMNHSTGIEGEVVITQDDTVLMRQVAGPWAASGVLGPFSL